MEFREFVEKIRKEVSDSLGDAFKVGTKSVKKNNGIILEVLMISQKESNIAPVIYLNIFYDLYQSGVALAGIVQRIMDAYEKSMFTKSLNMDFFREYQNVAAGIVCKLINYEWNKELLEDVPFQRFFDLAIVCYYAYHDEEVGSGTILIYNNHLEAWGIEEKALFEAAIANTISKLGYTYQSMNEVLQEIYADGLREKMLQDLPEEASEEEKNILEELIQKKASIMVGNAKEQEQQAPMYILSNPQRLLGAVCMLDMEALKEMGKIIGMDFYILPSSVHELILVPAIENEVENLKALVKEVNTTKLEEEEVLSDSVYYYDRKKASLVRCK